MAKKRKQKERGGKEVRGEKNDWGGKEKKGLWGGLREETRNSIIGILLLIVAVVLIIAATGSGGYLGTKTYNGVHYLFGVGYYILPLLFVLLGVNFFRAGGTTSQHLHCTLDLSFSFRHSDSSHSSRKQKEYWGSVGSWGTTSCPLSSRCSHQCSLPSYSLRCL